MESLKCFLEEVALPMFGFILIIMFGVWAILGPLMYMEGAGKAQQIKMQTGEDVAWYVALGMPSGGCKCK